MAYRIKIPLERELKEVLAPMATRVQLVI